MKIFLSILGLIGLVLVGITLIVKIRDKGKEQRQWKLLALLSYCVFPLLFAFGVFSEKMNSMKTVEFCGSCHTMTSYVESLTIDDDEPLSSVHFRNNYIPQETACYSCHTSYAMFGGVKAKMNGIRHVWVYLTEAEKDSITLYEPYSNNNCLHCHGPAEKFRKNKEHRKEQGLLKEIQSGQKSCLAAGCHDMGHYFESEESGDEW